MWVIYGLDWWHARRVCTKNFIHFDCVRESHNVSDDGCAILLLSDAVGFAVQVE
jgi:hypothetical protein